MSGDVGLQDEPILFYDEEMTISKLIVLKHKGVEFDMYNKVMKKINKKNDYFLFHTFVICKSLTSDVCSSASMGR